MKKKIKEIHKRNKLVFSSACHVADANVDELAKQGVSCLQPAVSLHLVHCS